MSLVVFKWIAPLGVVGRAPRCRWSRLWVNPITPQPPYQPSGWSYRYKKFGNWYHPTRLEKSVSKMGLRSPDVGRLTMS